MEERDVAASAVIGLVTLLLASARLLFTANVLLL